MIKQYMCEIGKLQNRQMVCNIHPLRLDVNHEGHGRQGRQDDIFYLSLSDDVVSFLKKTGGFFVIAQSFIKSMFLLF